MRYNPWKRWPGGASWSRSVKDKIMEEVKDDGCVSE
jgi:hypothetical protein